jgi:oligopeptide transport system ATP-binding protein
VSDLLKVDNVSCTFPGRRSWMFGPRGKVRALDSVSLTLSRRETLAVVGESGSGKSTLGRVILQLVKPSAGHITFNGVDLAALRSNELRSTRRQMSMIFQDPYSSLDPTWTVSRIISEPLDIHGVGDRPEKRRQVEEIARQVGLNTAALKRYPRQFSGGQRQRIVIARALITRPKLVVCDEPVSALDVSTRAQVLTLLKRLQDELDLSYLFISHDISVVEAISQRIAVMYLGRIVETGATDTIISRPAHPYTASLLSAVPVANPRAERRRTRIPLPGEPPSPLSPPNGCHFHPRCSLAMDICRTSRPALTALKDGRSVACHLHSGATELQGETITERLHRATISPKRLTPPAERLLA